MTRLSDTNRARSLLGKRGAFEGAFRWPWMASGMGTDDAHTPATNRSRHNAQRVVEKVGRSITNSETPQSHERVFSSGGDLGGFSVGLVEKHVANERFVYLLRLVGELGKPSVCAASGHVLAGALGLALACDLVIATEDARFGTPEIRVGLFPFMIMALIYRNVPRKSVAELMLLGEQISALDAHRIGIVNRVVTRADFDAWSMTGRSD